jgi:UDP-glucose 4-epimerase
MTRFLLSLDQAADTVFAALRTGRRGETFVPLVESASIVDLAKAMIDGRDIDVVVTGIRPGEKIHEIMVSDEERYRTIRRGDYYVIQPMLQQLDPVHVDVPMATEYSSENVTLDQEGIKRLLASIIGARAVVAGIAA